MRLADPLRPALHSLGQDEGVDRRVVVGLRHEPVRQQPIEHLGEPVAALLGMHDRVVGGRRLHQPRQEGRLDEREVAGLLAEVGLGGGADAVRVLPEEHGVEVTLEDLVLALVLLEPDGVGHLQQLVASVAFEPGHVVVLDDLHRDRRGALHRTLGREVRQRRPEQAADVDAVVDVELAILDREEGLDHVPRDLREGDRLAVLDLEHADLVARRVVHVRA